MKKIIKEFKEKGITQITIADERWYEKNGVFVPSVTWICQSYPKGIGYMKWLADRGWDEAEALKVAAGDKGSKVHMALEDMIAGKTVKLDSKYVNKSTGQDEELTLEEYDCLRAFAQQENKELGIPSGFVEKMKPKLVASEFVVFNEKDGYAGTVDCLMEIEGETWLIDFKTSQYVWPEHELQVSAYKHAIDKKIDKLGILQLGYRLNKNGWKLTEVEDKYPLFLSAKAIWQNEHGEEKPKVRNYPDTLKVEVQDKKAK